jgi:hypothetical protein
MIWSHVLITITCSYLDYHSACVCAVLSPLKYSIFDFVAQLLSSSEKLKMKCWVQIVDSHRVSYKESSATRVTVDANAIIDDLRKAVKAENPTILSSIEASQLTVYATKADRENKQSLNPRQSLDIETEYLVVVPDDTQKQGTYSLMFRRK